MDVVYHAARGMAGQQTIHSATGKVIGNWSLHKALRTQRGTNSYGPINATPLLSNFRLSSNLKLFQEWPE
jgi:hypothetical protein